MATTEDGALSPVEGSIREQQLEVVIADYIRSCESGTLPDRGEILQRHPELATELRDFFGQHDRMNRIAEPIRCFGDDLSQALGPGQKLSYVGNYELLEEIARGGMGVIYKARQTTLGRIVAVKMIVAGRLATEEDVQRFLVEAKAVAGLQHPNIVAIHEVGQHEGWHYFSMDYVEGRDLAKILWENVLPAKQAAGYVRQMAEAIHYAHQQGTLHRDLKPSNILIDEHDQVRITDFGLAMRVEGDSDLTRTGQILGTPSYMPPEQAQGKRSLIGPGSDVYSLGAILYECLTGRAPFRADSVMKTIDQVIHVEAASPRLLNPGVPRDLETSCLKCLQKDPHRRYGTAQLLADDLQRFLDDRPILARPVGTIERTRRWCRRNPTVASLLTTTALCLIVGTTVSWYFAIEARSLATSEAFHRGRADNNSALAEEQRKNAERKSKLLQRALYFSDMDRVQSAWEVGQFAAAVERLDQYRALPGEEDLRGFEWSYWNRKLHDQDTLSKPHTRWDRRGDVIRVAFTSDGNRLVSLRADCTVDFWSVATRQQIRTVKCPGINIDVAVFSRDGMRIASSSGSTVVLWDAEAGQQLRTLKGHTGAVNCVAFNRDGAWLASASADNTVKLWDTRTGQEMQTLKGQTQTVLCVTFSPDGLRIATMGNNTMKLWDTGTGQEIATFDGLSQSGYGVAFSPNLKQFAYGSDDNSVKLLDATTGQETLTLSGHTEFVTDVLFSPDGTQIASASADKTVKVWDAATGRENFTFKGHTAEIWCVAFSPNGTRIASASDDDTVKHWDVLTGDEIITIKANPALLTLGSPREHTIADSIKNVLSLAFSPDGTRLVSASYDGKVITWDTATGQEALALNGKPSIAWCIAFSPDGSRIASGNYDGTVTLWDSATGRQEKRFTPIANGQVRSVAFSPDSRHIASAINTGRSGGHIKLTNAATGEQTLSIDVDTPPLFSIAFSPDGTRIVGGGGYEQSGVIKVWNSVTGDVFSTLTGHDAEVWCVAYSPDGTRIASASGDRTVRLWNAISGEEIREITGYEHLVPCAAFTPDGNRLVTGNGHNFHRQMGDLLDYDYPGELKLWDSDTGQETLTLKGHTGPIICLAVSRDGTQIASASFDGTIKIWKAPKVGIR